MHPQESSKPASDRNPEDSTTTTKTIQEKPTMEKTDSMVSAVNSGNSIEAIKGRIIATHKLLKYLETSRNDLKEEKARVNQLQLENQQVSQKLTNREMYIKQLEAEVEDKSKRQQSNTAEISKLKKDLSALKGGKESIQTTYRSLQAEHIILKKQYNELKKEYETWKSNNDNKHEQPSSSSSYNKLKEQYDKLQKERDEWEEKYDAMEDDKMEMNINYEMLQNSLAEAKQEVAKMESQKKEIDVLRNKAYELSKMKSQQQELETLRAKSQELETLRAKAQELEMLRTKVQDSDTLRAKVQELQGQLVEAHEQSRAVTPVSQPPQPHPIAEQRSTLSVANNDNLIRELRKRVVENQKLLEEKRVLQDRYTELLVVNSRMTEQQRNTNLAPYIPEFGNMSPSLSAISTQRSDWDDFYENDSLSPEVPSLQLPQHHKQPKAITSSSTSSSNLQKTSRNPSNPSPPLPQPPSSMAPLATSNTVSRSTSPPSVPSINTLSSSQRIAPPPQEIKKAAPKKTRAPRTNLEKLAGMRLPGIARKRKADEPTTSTTINSKNNTSASASATSTSTSTPLITAASSTDTNTPGAARPYKRPNITPIPSIKGLEDYVQKFSKNLPTETIHELSSMAEYVTKLKNHFALNNNQPHPLFECIASFYKESRSHANPVLKSDPNAESQNHGLPENLYLICPSCIDGREKNIAWMIFAYCSLYEKYYMHFVDLCGWPSLENSTSLTSRLMEFSRVLVSEEYRQLESLHPVAFGDLRFNLVKAFELTYYRVNDWKTTYDNFIVDKLWPLMNNPRIADTCLELMALLVRTGLQPTVADQTYRRNRTGLKETEHTGIKIIRDKLIQALHVSEETCSKDDFILQMTAAKGLLLFSNNQLSVAMPVIIWYQNINDQLRHLLPSELDSNINMLQNCLKRDAIIA
ncbi:hypothetical protein INT45_009058 [Circinella minor]|uniref:Uncharacterized protein n=1 Tax=Circinella minor TaxID=1195481 RepID=A0A8H7SB12_9FUNG|nr:hypothetical protein INT45_009058 [Circinella minor]